MKVGLTDVTHVLAGVLTSIASFLNPTLAILTFVGFIIYELDESWHLSDQAFQDILEYLIGLYGGFISLLLSKALGLVWIV